MSRAATVSLHNPGVTDVNNDAVKRAEAYIATLTGDIKEFAQKHFEWLHIGQWKEPPVPPDAASPEQTNAVITTLNDIHHS